MSIDDVQEMMEPEQTLHERVAKKRYLVPITELSQHQGNRIVSHFYPEHWAQVQLARATRDRYAQG